MPDRQYVVSVDVGSYNAFPASSGSFTFLRHPVLFVDRTFKPMPELTHEHEQRDEGLGTQSGISARLKNKSRYSADTLLPSPRPYWARTKPGTPL